MLPGRWVAAGRAVAFSETAGQKAMPVTNLDNDPDKARRFREMTLPYLDDVYTLARYLLRDASDAEDAVQECYLRALKHFDTYRGPAIKPWLFAILRNVCRAEYARRAEFVDAYADKAASTLSNRSPIERAVLALIEAGDRLGHRTHVGLTATAPGFFGAQGRPIPQLPIRYPDLAEDMARQRVMNFEMEASALLVLSTLARCRAGVVCAVYAQRTTGAFIEGAAKDQAEAACVAVEHPPEDARRVNPRKAEPLDVAARRHQGQ